MSGPEPPPPVGLVGMVSRLGDDLVRALPPAFLLLVVLNLCFLGMVMWFIQSQQESKNVLLNTVVDRCMSIALHSTPPPDGH